MRLLLLVGAVLALALVIDRLMVAAEARNWVYWRRRPTSGSATAAALAPLHALTQPSYQYVIAEQEHQQLAVAPREDGEPPVPGPSHPAR